MMKPNCIPGWGGVREHAPGELWLIVPGGIAWAFLLFFMRSVTLRWIIKPVAKMALPGPVLGGERNDQVAQRKFHESAWRLCCSWWYMVLGLTMIHHKPWVWNFNHFYVGWPWHPVEEDIRRYYAAGLGLYLHQTGTFFLDSKLRDFRRMALHHFVTLILIITSWYIRMFRPGSFVLLMHDISDVLLETAKLFNYSRPRHHWASIPANAFFGLFTFSFIFLRLGVFPMVVIGSYLQGACEISCINVSMGCGLIWYALLSLLLILQTLQILWACGIARVVRSVLVDGKELADERETEKLEKVA